MKVARKSEFTLTKRFSRHKKAEVQLRISAFIAIIFITNNEFPRTEKGKRVVLSFSVLLIFSEKLDIVKLGVLFVL